MVGIRINIGRNAPINEPKVDMAESKPAVFPAFWVSFNANFNAKGDTIPSKVTGITNKIKIVKKEPAKIET